MTNEPPQSGRGSSGLRAADDPQAYIALDRRLALGGGAPIPVRSSGSAIFADVSGFTLLTEALRDELGPQRGVEALTATLDRVFHAVIGELHRYGGDVIYFSGDAITGWLAGDDGHRAVASALAMQRVMADLGSIATAAGTPIRLRLKVAIATGEVRRAVVGDPAIQRIDVLAGRLLDELAETERQAGPGEILLAGSTLRALGDTVTASTRMPPTSTGATLGVAHGLAVDVAEAPPTAPPALAADVVREWLLPVVYERLSTGRGEFLAELRAAYPVFLRFGGLDFDADPAAIDKLDEFVAGAQQVFVRYGGNVLQLTLGDKGAHLYGVFGSPVSHEDDAERAAAAALELLGLERSTQAQEIRVGIAWGPLRSGTYGHLRRRTFVCLGDAVNTAARLMSAAPAGHVYASAEVRRAAGDGFVWSDLGRLPLKGKARPVAVAELITARDNVSRRKLRYELPMVGRSAELQALDAALQAAQRGSSRMIGVSAEAGLGKSRLIAEFVRTARRRGQLVAFGECQSFGVNVSYFAWREVWRRLLSVDDDVEPAAQRAAAELALQRIDSALLPRLPLLAEVLGISIPDSELTASFDAKLRKASLEDMLARCLQARAAAEPVVVVLEDCHWIDPLSRDLLEALARATRRHRVLFVVAYRPARATGGDLGIHRLPHFQELLLTPLGATDIRAVIAAKVRASFSLEQPPPALAELVLSRSDGNPFYAEELLNYIAGQGIDPADAAALRALQLPDTLNRLVLSRIDALPERPRRALKVASIIGRLFLVATLPGAYPELGSLDEVVVRLETLKDLDLLTADQADASTYMFRHVITQEVSYNSMPFGLRAELHRRVGEYIERTESADLAPHLDLLAHHFWHGDDPDKKRAYLLRAEESARHRYANATAIDYLERLLTLVDGAQRADVLLRLGKVLELTGDWTRSEAVAREALALADAAQDPALTARCETALAEVARKHGHYGQAVERLERAAATFESLADDAGMGLVLHVTGTIAAQRGDLEAARDAYERSLEIRTRSNDRAALASLHSNLAIVAQFRGDFDGARAASERALAIRHDIGDTWGIGVSHNNIGMIAFLAGNHGEARERFTEAIRLCRDAGDPWMEALARNNLGNAARELGDYATAHENYAATLETYRNNDDLWALAFLFEDLAILAARTAAAVTALELLGAADMLRAEIGSARTAEQEAALAAELAPARSALDEEIAAAATRRGRGWSVTASIEHGLAFAAATS